MGIYQSVDVSALPPCCQDWVTLGKPGEPQRSVCPQHKIARKMRGEELTWADSYKHFKASFDEAWSTAGFSIS